MLVKLFLDQLAAFGGHADRIAANRWPGASAVEDQRGMMQPSHDSNNQRAEKSMQSLGFYVLVYGTISALWALVALLAPTGIGNSILR